LSNEIRQGKSELFQSFYYKNCGECAFSDWVDDNWVSCGHPDYAKACAEDAQLRGHDRHEGKADGPIPETCPLRRQRACLGIKEGC